MIEHRGVVNLIQAQIAYFGVHASSRVLQFASFSFDASISEIFMVLGCGASLYLPLDTVRRDQRRLWEYFAQYSITHATLPPALLQDSKDLPSLKAPLTLILAGEAPSVALFKMLRQQGIEVFNAYGPTEITVCATAWHGLSELEGEVVPIGRPIANTCVYLLDAHGLLVPLGATGELYIGGAGVARGYLNLAKLSAERFLPDPFNHRQEARMYKTGDLARYRPDGNLEFLGRSDYQIKLRGFRIEPGEIEACLITHPQVGDAVVLAWGGDDHHRTKRLVAYVVVIGPEERLASVLRAYLAARLPAYMVPAAFVLMAALPLTGNGKLDRHALPAPDKGDFAGQAYEMPQGDVETTLAAIWAELLGVERLSRHDDFFALGGHSLLAVRMINRSRTLLGIEIAMRTLFEAPTIAALARRLLMLDACPDDSFAILLPLQPNGSRLPLFCIHPVSGLSWHYRSLANHLGGDQPVYGLQAEGLDGRVQLAQTIEVMAANYIEHIRRVQPNEPYHLLGWSLGGKIAHSMATQLEQQGKMVALLVLLDSYPNHFQQDDEPEIGDDAFCRKLLSRYNAENMPDTIEYLWEKTREVIKNNRRISTHFFPLVYRGDMLFFRAAVAENELLPLASPDLWKPYVLGKIETYDIHCKHDDMDQAASIAEISRILIKKLDTVQKHQPLQIDKGFLV